MKVVNSSIIEHGVIVVHFLDILAKVWSDVATFMNDLLDLSKGIVMLGTV